MAIDTLRGCNQLKLTHQTFNRCQCTYQLQFKADIRSALDMVQSNRAAGPDGVISELFQLAPNSICEVIFNLWHTAGRLSYIPYIFHQGIVVPIYKKGDPSEPISYRPITLLSHIREVVSLAINNALKHSYKFNKCQYGFSPRSGTEVATLHAHKLTQTGHNLPAVLDLKQAYPSVRRHHILQACAKSLPDELTAMVNNLLLDIHVTTRNQHSFRSAAITLGVPQGDPVSPTLHNIFMDSFFPYLNCNSPTISNTPAICYADDVLLASKTTSGMQQMLDQCTTWAQNFNMHWAPNKSCIITNNTSLEFHLNTHPLQCNNSATYLGTSLAFNGLRDDSIQKRARACIEQLAKWRRVERESLLLTRFTRQIQNSKFLLPAADFSMHLVEPSTALQQLMADLLKQCTKWIFPSCSNSHLNRASALARLPSFSTRRKILIHNRLQRLHSNAVTTFSSATSDSKQLHLATSSFILTMQHHSFSEAYATLRLPASHSTPPPQLHTSEKNQSFLNLQSET